MRTSGRESSEFLQGHLMNVVDWDIHSSHASSLDPLTVPATKKSALNWRLGLRSLWIRDRRNGNSHNILQEFVNSILNSMFMKGLAFGQDA